jgi:hypothetical protein
VVKYDFWSFEIESVVRAEYLIGQVREVEYDAFKPLEEEEEEEKGVIEGEKREREKWVRLYERKAIIIIILIIEKLVDIYIYIYVCVCNKTKPTSN